MKVFSLFFLGFVLSLTLPMKSHGQTNAIPDQPNKIYLKSTQIDPKFDHLKTQVIKNSFDVVYDVDKFELFLADEQSMKLAYIQKYERLTVVLRTHEVEVTLSEKIVVRRRLEEFSLPLLELRLALYELFLGKQYMEKHGERLSKKSLARIERIQKIVVKQDEIAQKKNVKNKSNVPVIPPPPVIPKVTPPVQALPSAIKPEDLSAQKTSTTPEASKGPEVAVPKPIETPPVVDPKAGDDDSPLKPEILSPQPIEQNPVAKNVKSKRTSFKVVNSETENKFSMFFGFSNLKGINNELISTTTELNFINIGGRFTRDLKKKGNTGFWYNLDYEGRFAISKASSTKGYAVKLGRKIEGHAGTTTLERFFGVGGTFTFENIMIGTVKPPSEGVDLANINAFLLGPELKIKTEFREHKVFFYTGYQMAIFSNSNIKQADYSVAKLYGDLTFMQKEKWGYGVKLENYFISGSRTFGTSKIQISVMSFNLYYQF